MSRRDWACPSNRVHAQVSFARYDDWINMVRTYLDDRSSPDIEDVEMAEMLEDMQRAREHAHEDYRAQDPLIPAWESRLRSFDRRYERALKDAAIQTGAVIDDTPRFAATYAGLRDRLPAWEPARPETLADAQIRASIRAMIPDRIERYLR